MLTNQQLIISCFSCLLLLSFSFLLLIFIVSILYLLSLFCLCLHTASPLHLRRPISHLFLAFLSISSLPLRPPSLSLFLCSHSTAFHVFWKKSFLANICPTVSVEPSESIWAQPGSTRLREGERERRGGDRERGREGSVHKNQQCRNNRDLGFSLSPLSENKLSEKHFCYLKLTKLQ